MRRSKQRKRDMEIDDDLSTEEKIFLVQWGLNVHNAANRPGAEA